MVCDGGVVVGGDALVAAGDSFAQGFDGPLVVPFLELLEVRVVVCVVAGVGGEADGDGRVAGWAWGRGEWGPEGGGVCGCCGGGGVCVHRVAFEGGCVGTAFVGAVQAGEVGVGGSLGR